LAVVTGASAVPAVAGATGDRPGVAALHRDVETIKRAQRFFNTTGFRALGNQYACYTTVNLMVYLNVTSARALPLAQRLVARADARGLAKAVVVDDAAFAANRRYATFLALKADLANQPFASQLRIYSPRNTSGGAGTANLCPYVDIVAPAFNPRADTTPATAPARAWIATQQARYGRVIFPAGPSGRALGR